MPECDNPLWPCAMTGAAACLAGFDGVAVVIHGSSGCYYYPTTLLHAPLHGSFILENEVIFGSEASTIASPRFSSISQLHQFMLSHLSHPSDPPSKPRSGRQSSCCRPPAAPSICKVQ